MFFFIYIHSLVCRNFITFYISFSDASPELLYWFSEQTLQPGPTVSLKCVATGNPLPQFTWTLDGFPVSFFFLASTLNFFLENIF